MNYAKFKDPVFNMCLAGTAVASWSLTQEVTGFSPFTVQSSKFIANIVKGFDDLFASVTEVFIYN